MRILTSQVSQVSVLACWLCSGFAEALQRLCRGFAEAPLPVLFQMTIVGRHAQLSVFKDFKVIDVVGIVVGVVRSVGIRRP